MPFLQEQKTVTGADLFRPPELENTGCNTFFYEHRYQHFVFIVIGNELISFALLTGDG